MHDLFCYDESCSFWYFDRKWLILNTKPTLKQLSGFFLIVGLLTLAWVSKTFYFVGELELSPHKKLLLTSSLAFALILTSFLIKKPTRLKLAFSASLYVIFSFVLYADAVYERYYDAILHIELMGQADQLGDVADSIISLLYWSDLWYWFDLPFVFCLLYVLYRKPLLPQKKFMSIGTFVIGIALTVFTALQLQTTYSDQYKVALTGIIPAHVFDLTHFVLGTSTASGQINEVVTVEKLESYFEENQATQQLSPYFGQFKGSNVIVIQTEALNEFPIGLEVEGQEVTPNLNKLIDVSHFYPNSYLQIGRGNTSDAEFVANNSLYPMATKGIYKTYPSNDYISLPNVLKEYGYTTSAVHGNTPEFWNREVAYKKQGFDTFYSSVHPSIDDSDTIGLGISDESMFKQMLDIYAETTEPFYSFLVTLTSHRPFELPEEYQALSLSSKFDDTAPGNYLQSIHYFDKALGTFIEGMKEKGLWDNTILVVYGDHYGSLPADAPAYKELLDIDFDQKESFKIPIIVHHPGQTEPVQSETIGSQMDIYPTITSLLGVDRPLAQMGQSLDAENRDSFVGFAYETTRYSFYSDDYDFEAAHNGEFESGFCTNNKTGKITDVKKCKPEFNKVVQNVNYAQYILENNMLGELFK